MVSGQNTPQVGIQPLKLSGHAIQIEADIQAFKEYCINLLDLQATTKAQEEMRKNIVQIKNILAAPAVKPTGANSLSYAQVLQKSYLLRTPMQPRPSSRLCEILIKIGNTVSESEIQTVSEETIKEKINKILEKSQVQDLKGVKTLAVKQHSSEDITLYTNDQNTTRKMQIYKKKWMKALEDTAALQIIIFEILIHEVSTAIDVTNIKEMKDKIQWNNSTLKTANVKYIE
ncbi:hypothetical protein GX48_07600 [Paracoccidioides brasiliensis]|nr:hypothetical protein GX48_07600 [Paracoccidioides brasiliensis]